MGLVRESRRDGNLVAMNRVRPARSFAACLIALGYCATSLADNTATVPRPGSLSQERLNSAAQNGTDFLVTHGNYAQTRYHPADRINTHTVKHLKLAWTRTRGRIGSSSNHPVTAVSRTGQHLSA